MTTHDANRLMHAVLDGEATPAESQELERLISADPALAARYGEWRRLFDAMGRLPRAYPPEGLVAAVMANIPQAPASADGQPSTPSRIFGVTSDSTRDLVPAPILRQSRKMASLGGFTMSEQINPANKRKIWIGAGVAAIAVVAVGGFMLDKPATDTQGTILPAARLIAPQPAAADIQVGQPGKPRSSPTDPSAPSDVAAAAQAEGAKAAGSRAAGAEAEGAKAAGQRALGAEAEGAKAAGQRALGAEAEGAKAAGQRALGAEAEGAKAAGQRAQGAQAEGAKAAGQRAQGAQAEGAKAAGQRALGAEAEGAKAAGQRAQGAQAEGAKAAGQRAQGAQAEGAKVQ